MSGSLTKFIHNTHFNYWEHPLFPIQFTYVAQRSNKWTQKYSNTFQKLLNTGHG